MVNVVPWDLPRHNIHHDTSSTFSNNVPESTFKTTLDEADGRYACVIKRVGRRVSVCRHLLANKIKPIIWPNLQIFL